VAGGVEGVVVLITVSFDIYIYICVYIHMNMVIFYSFFLITGNLLYRRRGRQFFCSQGHDYCGK
jgi:hypothetical protein